MFVRFRQRGSSLYASIVETHRRAGRVSQEHVVNLGSIDGHLAGEPAVIARWLFWKRANERLARIGNRIDAAADLALRTALYARIAMPTAAELRGAAIWEAERDAALWRNQHRSSLDIIATREHLIEAAQSALVDDRAATEHAAQQAAEAESRDPTEPRAERRPTLQELGLSKYRARQMHTYGAMTEAEMEAMLDAGRVWPVKSK